MLCNKLDEKWKPPKVSRADATEVVYEKKNMGPACKYPLYYYVAHAKEKVVQG